MCFSLSESGEIRSKEQNTSKNIRGPRLEHIKVTDLKLCLWRAALLKGGRPGLPRSFLAVPRQRFSRQNICAKAQRQAVCSQIAPSVTLLLIPLAPVADTSPAAFLITVDDASPTACLCP